MEEYTVESALKSEQFKGLIGDSRRYKNSKGEISLIHPCVATHELFEIFCIEGDLFDDIERFDNLPEAESRIKELLGE